MKITLTVTEGPEQGKSATFRNQPLILVGRSRMTHFPLSGDEFLSRVHYGLVLFPGNCRVRDLKSRNGTMLNGENVEEKILADGDQIKAGSSVVRASIKYDIPVKEGPVTCLKCGEESSEWGMGSSFIYTCPRCREALLEEKPEIPGYEIIKELEYGSLGAVYFARKSGEATPCALKVIIPPQPFSEQAQQQFLKQMDLVAGLGSNRRIVQMHEKGYLEGYFYLATEYISGTSAAKEMELCGGGLPARQACLIAMQVMEGLSYAHKKGFVHCHINPSTIVLQGRGKDVQAVLSDFAVIRNLEVSGLCNITGTGIATDSFPYIAPEMILDYANAKPATDIYALAATLYHMLTGAPPIDFEIFRDSFDAVFHAAPRRLSTPPFPSPLSGIVDRALAKNITQRPQTADQFRFQLQAALDEVKDQELEDKQPDDV
jgi:eukaryotic-like serine/threonine-protein kinase